MRANNEIFGSRQLTERFQLQISTKRLKKYDKKDQYAHAILKT
jgi:hypothetical protein